MWAGHMPAPRRVELVDIPLDRAHVSARPDEPKVLVRPVLACLCGSDLLYFEGDYPEYRPRLGQSLHEMIARVEESQSDAWQPGDRVLALPEAHFGFYERFWVAADRLLRVPAELRPEHAVIAQPLGTVLFAVRKLPPLLGKTVLVLGQGPIGLLWSMVLRRLGARSILAVDPVPERRQAARAAGAAAAWDPQDERLQERVFEATGSTGPDLVVEAVGHRETVLREAIDWVRPGGTVLMFGVPCQTLDAFPLRTWFLKNVRLVASVDSRLHGDFGLAMQWIAEGRIDVEQLLTHRFALADVQEAFDLFASRRDGALKVLLDLEVLPA